MKTVRIEKTVYKVNDFISWQRSGSLDLRPVFQRRSVWPAGAKSYFIDTVVKGLPIPIVFLREKTDLRTLEPIREVVDGQQRLRTLISFIDGDLLDDYDPEQDDFMVRKAHNKDIANKSFKQLHPDVRRHILDYSFSVHVLSSDTADSDVLRMFARLNSTGLKLNEQELRNGDYFGEFKSSMYDLAYEQLSRWRKWGVFKDSDIARMQEVEATSEFALLMLQGLEGKTQKALNDIYKKYDKDFPKKHEVMRRFRLVMDEVDDLVGEELAELEFSRKALFHTLFTFIYDEMFGLETSLSRMRSSALPRAMAQCIRAASERIAEGGYPDGMANAFERATSDVGARSERLKFVRRVCRASKTKP
jgi:hypothetical protein